MKVNITQEYLQQRLLYDPETGMFTWLPNPNANKTWNTRFTGKVAGTLCKTTGYINITIDGYKHGAHRLAFLYMDGYMPPRVDHKDTIRINNIWSNLRAATSAQNNWNASMKSSNTSGFKGVYLDKRINKYVGRLRVGDKRLSTKYFNTPEEASEQLELLRLEHHKEFARSK